MEKKNKPSKFKKMLAENKVLLVLGIILIACFTLIVLAVFKYFYSGNSKSNYGDRLEGIEKHPINKNLKSDIEALYPSGEIDKVTIDSHGKIIYITLNLKEVTSKENAKALAIKTLDVLTEDEKGFYDIQYVITCTSELEPSEEEGRKNYPILGYKNSTSSVIVWTNN